MRLQKAEPRRSLDYVELKTRTDANLTPKRTPPNVTNTVRKVGKKKQPEYSCEYMDVNFGSDFTLQSNSKLRVSNSNWSNIISNKYPELVHGPENVLLCSMITRVYDAFVRCKIFSKMPRKTSICDINTVMHSLRSPTPICGD